MRKLLRNWLSQNKQFFYKKNYKQILLVVFLFLSKSFTSQNIANYVSNGGFESLGSNSLSTLYSIANYWQPIDTNQYAYYLYSTRPGITNAPYCAQGFQEPRHGNNFIAPDFYCSTCGYTYCRGYPRNRLKQNLIANKIYCAKYYIVNTNNCPVAIDSYGIFFADNSLDTIHYCDMALSYITPQIQTPSNVIFHDTLNWMLVTGTFVANGTEKYMVLGNFKSDANTNTLLINPTYSASLTNDIYIDDVSVIELDLPAYAGPDLWCIPGDSVFIGRQPDVGIDEDCMWYKLPNTTTPIDTVAGLWVKPTTTTTYIVKQDICGVIKWDTVIVNQSATGINQLGIINNELKVYPIPTKDELTISLNIQQANNFNAIKIFNSLGQLIREEEINFKDNKTILKTSELPNGVYVLKLKGQNDFEISKRFVIAR